MAISTASAALMAAIVKLYRIDVCHPESVKSWAYHDREKPSGGKFRYRFSFTDPTRTTTSGASRNTRTNAVMVHRHTRIYVSVLVRDSMKRSEERRVGKGCR